MMLSNPAWVTAADTMAILDDVVNAALAAPLIELAKPDNEVKAYAEVVSGVLLVITRDPSNIIHFRAECEFRCISVDLLQHQALAISQYIFDIAGVDTTLSEEQSF